MIPRVFQNRMIAVPGVPATALVLGAASQELDVPLEPQLGDQWCWAAVSVAIGRFFGRPPRTQCQLARTLVPGCSDCTDGVKPSPACDKASDLVRGLQAAGVAATQRPGTLLPSEVLSIINGTPRKPVACFIDFDPPTIDHFVIITNFLQSPARYVVRDPRRPRREIPVDVFTNNYDNAGGKWRAFFTIP